MSTLWTPSGERPIRREEPAGGSGQPAGGWPGGRRAGDGEAPPEGAEVEEASAEAELLRDQLRDQLARTPAIQVVASHAFGLLELAAVQMSLKSPQLDEARLAIDATAALVDGVAGRLGEFEGHLREALTQLRLTYVDLKSRQDSS